MTQLFAPLAVRDDRATLRVGDPAGPSTVVKISIIEDGFANEVHAREVLRRAGLPVEAPLSYVPGPPALLTMPWVEGQPIDATCARHSLQQVGELLATIHAMPATGPFAGNVSWSAWMKGWLSHALEWWDTTVPDEAGAMDQMRDTLTELSEAMDNAAVSTILFDAPPAHFLCNPNGQINMIDVEQLRAGDPAMDLAVLELWDPETISPVLDGYQREERIKGAFFGRRRAFYVVLRALAAAEWHSTALASPALRDRFLRVAKERATRIQAR